MHYTAYTVSFNTGQYGLVTVIVFNFSPRPSKKFFSLL